MAFKDLALEITRPLISHPLLADSVTSPLRFKRRRHERHISEGGVPYQVQLEGNK